MSDRRQLSAIGRLVDAKTLAKHLSLSRRTVYDMARAGRIPSVKIGNRWRFDVVKVEQFLGGNL